MNVNQLKIQITRVEIERAEKILGIDLSDIPVRVSNRLTRLNGFCKFDFETNKVIEIVISGLVDNSEMTDLARHEIAHAATFILFGNHNHNSKCFVNICKQLDCSSAAFSNRKRHDTGYKFEAICNGCGNSNGKWKSDGKIVKSIRSGSDVYTSGCCNKSMTIKEI